MVHPVSEDQPESFEDTHLGVRELVDHLIVGQLIPALLITDQGLRFRSEASL